MTMKTEITGKIVKVMDTQEFGNNGFKKREIIIKADEYNSFPITLTKEKCEYADKYKAGDRIEATCYVNGRHWKDDKYFISLNCTFIKKVEGGAVVTPETETNASAPVEDDHSLPF